MTTGTKLIILRKKAGYSQEQLAELLEVSRQSVSKWESDLAYPETEKLIKLGVLYGCSMDYLLKEDVLEDSAANAPVSHDKQPPRSPSFEWKSKRTLAGIPLCHVNLGLGRSAKGIIAIGLAAKGVISLGIFSMGILSFGVFSLGLLSLGALALGGLAAGALAVGILAFGGICLGIIAAGGVAIGCFCAGGLAVGGYLAIGDYAYGDCALGVTKMVAREMGSCPFYGEDLKDAAHYLDRVVPTYLSWAKEIVKRFLL
ncbi:MAG: helix-turn-helix transcriptional regulator [Clostridia bacterium]|nr:helix-turn-helix transcriptional regulator [Clostridia bacterium]